MFMRRPAPGVFAPSAAELETLGGLARVIELVQVAQSSGLIAASRDAVQVAYTLWCAVHGIAALLVAKPYFPWGDRDDLIGSVLEMAVRGVATGAEDPDS